MTRFSGKKLKEISKKYRIADVYFFGSHVSGFARKGSDVDVAVRFIHGLPPAERRGKIYGDLFSDLTSQTKETNIDLVFLDEVPLHLQFRIVAEGEMIFSSNLENSYNFKENIINRYRDYKYFIDDFFKGLLAAPIP